MDDETPDPSPGRLPDRERCEDCGKAIYRSPSAAQRGRRLLHGHGKRGSSTRLITYRCPSGRGWHVGHQRGACT